MQTASQRYRRLYDKTHVKSGYFRHWRMTFLFKTKPRRLSLQQGANLVQVLIGFLATAYLTFFMMVVYYLAHCVDSKLLNAVDNQLLAALPSWTYLKSSHRLETTLRRAILMFSDQQAVTGIGLLASGYAQLDHGIQSYHWQILVYLTWFSSLTHLTTLSVLREYFRRNHAARFWRVILMLTTVIMLGVALLPTGDVRWLDGFFRPGSIPVRCFYSELASGDQNLSFKVDALATATMATSLFVLVSGFLTRLVKLSDRATSFSKQWLRSKPSQVHSSLCSRILQFISNHSKPHAWAPALVITGNIYYVLLETIYVLLKAICDIYESMLWEVRGV